ncbi:hypothetical protein OAU26_03680 [Mariniblastus sp.]|nr:hypothetical protein [Mariniblastus sp.]
MSRWKSNFNGHPRPGIRWWHAEDGKFVQRDDPTQVVMPVVEKFTRVDGRVFIELGMDVVCC